MERQEEAPLTTQSSIFRWTASIDQIRHTTSLDSSETAIPNTLFAKRLADQILKSPWRRPSYFTTGGLSRLMAFFRWMPWFFTRFMLMRYGGCNLVGK